MVTRQVQTLAERKGSGVEIRSLRESFYFLKRSLFARLVYRNNGVEEEHDGRQGLYHTNLTLLSSGQEVSWRARRQIYGI
jgi:hypothetical protein